MTNPPVDGKEKDWPSSFCEEFWILMDFEANLIFSPFNCRKTKKKYNARDYSLSSGNGNCKKKVSLPLVGQQAERAFTPFAKKKKMPAEKAYYAAESDVRYVDFLLSEESATITNVTQTDILTDAGVPLRSVFFKRYFFAFFTRSGQWCCSVTGSGWSIAHTRQRSKKWRALQTNKKKKGYFTLYDSPSVKSFEKYALVSRIMWNSRKKNKYFDPPPPQRKALAPFPSPTNHSCVHPAHGNWTIWVLSESRFF